MIVQPQPGRSTSTPQPRLSAVIPVFNSAAVIARTIEECVAFFERERIEYEIVAVDDGSSDSSWQVLKDCAARNANVVAVQLLRNYGQHSAVHCGLALSRGEYVVTLDDDMQNPPGEIAQLLRKADEGADVVFGRFHSKKHGLTRRIGSFLTNRVNNFVFGKPPDLVLTNFKLMHRSVVDRILGHRTQSPYINGLAILYARKPASALVEHRERAVGTSNYTLSRIAALLARILYNYSAFPLRAIAAMGMLVALTSFAYSAYILVKALLLGSSVPGWASMAFLLTFLNGTILLLLGVLGEYVVRILRETSRTDPYHILEIARQE